jgi:hypothetical protein
MINQLDYTFKEIPLIVDDKMDIHKLNVLLEC